MQSSNTPITHLLVSYVHCYYIIHSLLYIHLKYKEITQKVLTFKCSGTIGGSTQKELVMAPLPRKKHFKTVTLLFGEHFPAKVKSVSRGVNDSDDVTLYGTLQLIIFSPVST